jgi:hypothetical protein
MRTITFPQFWGYATAKVACRECGKVSRRNIREYCTVNPFNTRADGTPKSAQEVQLDACRRAENEAALQEDEGRICRICAKARGES